MVVFCIIMYMCVWWKENRFPYIYMGVTSNCVYYKLPDIFLFDQFSALWSSVICIIVKKNYNGLYQVKLVVGWVLVIALLVFLSIEKLNRIIHSIMKVLLLYL